MKTKNSVKDTKLRIWTYPKDNPTKVSYKTITGFKQAHLYLSKVKEDNSLCAGLEVYSKSGKSYKWITWVNGQGDDIDQVDQNGNSLTTQSP